MAADLLTLPRHTIALDTNVLLDVLMVREPHYYLSSLVLAAMERDDVRGLMVATTCTTLSYYVEKGYGADQAREDLGRLLGVLDVATVSRTVLSAALALRWDDFEDAVLHEAARLAGATAIVTRNAADFGGAALAVYTPAALLAAL